MGTQGFLSVEVPEVSTEPLAKLGSSRKDELVKKCVHALIILGQDKQPIKKTDLGRLVFSSVTNYRAVNGIIHMANEELQDVFGMRLYMIDDKSQPKFFLVNMSLAFGKYQPPRCEEENEELVIQHFALTEIFVSVDFRSTLEEIEKALKPFGLKEQGKDYMKNYLDKFVKHMYLGVTKYQDATFYTWGPRAYAEIELDQFFHSFLRISREKNPEAWPDLVKRLEEMKKLQKRAFFSSDVDRREPPPAPN